MPKLKAYGKVENGRLIMYSKSLFDNAIQTWRDCSATITVQSTSRGRSTKQNRYYRGCVIPILQDALKEQHGLIYASDDLHDFLKSKFNSIEICNQDGVVEKLPVSTTELNTAEFEAMMEEVRRWASDFLGVYVPLPNEQTELNFKTK